MLFIKYTIFAGSIIVVIIAAIFLNLLFLKNKTDTLAGYVTSAKQLVEKDKFEESKVYLDKFVDEYTKSESYFSSVIRHAELDSIRVLYQRVIHLNFPETKQDFLGESAALISMLDHLYKSEMPQTGNIL